MKEIYSRYLTYFENLNEDQVEKLRELAHPDLHFTDPFNDLNDIEQIIEVFSKMFRVLKEPRFRILDTAESDDGVYIRWEFTFQTRLLSGGPQHSFEGMSLLRERDGKIAEHRDFWDASTEVYRKMFLVGPIIGLIRRALA